MTVKSTFENAKPVDDASPVVLGLKMWISEAEEELAEPALVEQVGDALSTTSSTRLLHQVPSYYMNYLPFSEKLAMHFIAFVRTTPMF